MFSTINVGNDTYTTYKPPPGCIYSGPYKYDVRCRQWFLESLTRSQTTTVEPMFFYDSITHPSLVQNLCKRQVIYQNNTSTGRIEPTNCGFSVNCITLKISFIKQYFEIANFKSSKTIMIDPRTQKVVYNSVSALSSKIQYLKNAIDDILPLNTTKRGELLQAIQSHMPRQTSQVVLNSKQSPSNAPTCSLNTSKIQNLLSLQKVAYSNYSQVVNEINYHDPEYLKVENNAKSFVFRASDGEEIFVSINAVVIIEKLIDLEKKIGNSNSQKSYQLQDLFLAINLLPKRLLTAWTDKLIKEIQQYLLYFGISAIVLGVLLLLFTGFISYKVSVMIEIPLIHMIDLLNDFQKQGGGAIVLTLIEESVLLQDETLFLSHDMKILFESFICIFRMVHLATQDIFKVDNSYSLLQLNYQINFFKQFRNRRVLGICYNNIGNIHFQNKRYLESMENYQQALIFAYYEKGIYANENEELKGLELEKEFQETKKITLSLNEKLKEQKALNSQNKRISLSPSIRTNKDTLQIICDSTKVEMISVKNEKEPQTQEIILEVIFDRKFNFSQALYMHNLTQENGLRYDNTNDNENRQNNLSKSKGSSTLIDWEYYQRALLELIEINKQFTSLSYGRNIILYSQLSLCHLKMRQFDKAVQFQALAIDKYESSLILEDIRIKNASCSKGKELILNLSLNSNIIHINEKGRQHEEAVKDESIGSLSLAQDRKQNVENSMILESNQNNTQKNDLFHLNEDGGSQEIGLVSIRSLLKARQAQSRNRWLPKNSNSIANREELNILFQQEIFKKELLHHMQQNGTMSILTNHQITKINQSDYFIFERIEEDMKLPEKLEGNALSGQYQEEILKADAIDETAIQIDDNFLMQKSKSMERSLRQQEQPIKNKQTLGNKGDYQEQHKTIISPFYPRPASKSYSHRTKSNFSSKLTALPPSFSNSKENSKKIQYSPRKTTFQVDEVDLKKSSKNNHPRTQLLREYYQFDNPLSKRYQLSCSSQKSMVNKNLKQEDLKQIQRYQLPSDVLLFCIGLQEARILKAERRQYEASLVLTDLLEKTKFYLPFDRLKCLSELEETLYTFSLDVSSLKKMTQRFDDSITFNVSCILAVSKESSKAASTCVYLVNDVLTNEKHDTYSLMIYSDDIIKQLITQISVKQLKVMGEYFNYILESCQEENLQCSRSSIYSDDVNFDNHNEHGFHQLKNNVTLTLNQDEISVNCMSPHFFLSQHQNDTQQEEEKQISKQSTELFFSSNNSKNCKDKNRQLQSLNGQYQRYLIINNHPNENLQEKKSPLIPNKEETPQVFTPVDSLSPQQKCNSNTNIIQESQILRNLGPQGNSFATQRVPERNNEQFMDYFGSNQSILSFQANEQQYFSQVQSNNNSFNNLQGQSSQEKNSIQLASKDSVFMDSVNYKKNLQDEGLSNRGDRGKLKNSKFFLDKPKSIPVLKPLISDQLQETIESSQLTQDYVESTSRSDQNNLIGSNNNCNNNSWNSEEIQARLDDFRRLRSISKESQVAVNQQKSKKYQSCLKSRYSSQERGTILIENNNECPVENSTQEQLCDDDLEGFSTVREANKGLEREIEKKEDEIEGENNKDFLKRKEQQQDSSKNQQDQEKSCYFSVQGNSFLQQSTITQKQNHDQVLGIQQLQNASSTSPINKGSKKVTKDNINLIFHLSVRKAILSYLNKNQESFLHSKNLMKLNFLHKSKKFIVFITDQPGITKNKAYFMLAELLYVMQIQLLVLQLHYDESQKEQNDISDFFVKDKSVIKYFYTQEKLLQYIRNKREPMRNFGTPLLMEHFQV